MLPFAILAGIGSSIFVPPLPTVTLTAAEVALAPVASVAFAVRECAPAARFAVKLYGPVVSSPRSVLLSKNSTLEMALLVEEAFASMVTLPGAAKLALFTGLVMLTVGGVAPPWTMIVPVISGCGVQWYG